jgi:hypothetical protein
MFYSILVLEKFLFPTLVDTIWLLRQFLIDIFKDYLGLPIDSTHFNIKQNKRNDAHAKLRCIEHAVTPRVLQLYPPKRKSRPEISRA